MSVDAAAQIQLAGGILRAAVLFRLATAPLVRLWTGVGSLTVAADAVETLGGVYAGIGAMSGLPAVQSLINGLAERVEFTLSGAAIDGRAVALADAEAADIRGAQVNLGLVLFDANWAPVTGTIWLWQGEADTPKITRRVGEGGDVVRQVTISVGSIFTDRRRPALSYYTDVEQRRRSATDRFCERTPLYSQQVAKSWPRL